MQDTDHLPSGLPPDDALRSAAPGVSLLDSILLLLTPEQQQHFLASAGVEGVVYANRAPTFDKTLAIRLTRTAFHGLLNMLGRVAQEVPPEQQVIDYNDPEPLAILKEELEGGVRFAPPSLDWFKYHPEGDEVPIRVESRRFGIPCRLRRDRYRGGAYLHAVFLGTPDTRRGPAETEAEAVVQEEEALADPVDIEHLSTDSEESSVPAQGQAMREFVPHVRTTWDVTGPHSGEMPDIDAVALERLVFQVAANRRYNSLSRSTRERCEMLEGLIRLKQFASQYPYILESNSGSTFELHVQGPPETLSVIKRAYVYCDSSDGSRRDRVPGLILERVGWRNHHQVFCIPEGFQCDPPPASGYLVDAGDISQLQKQLDALRELRHPSSRPHLLKLAALLTAAPSSAAAPVAGEMVAIRLIDGQLTERQTEAVRKALATPDVCLIQGPPGTGKTRVISEIVRQAVRRNWKVLLVAPTHVAVDNVLERIGIQEDVSPVRCVRQEKLDELPEHIQEFTYERRAALLAHETGRRSEADRSAWQCRLGRLAAALEALKRCADYRATAEQIEHDISALRIAISDVPKEVESKFAIEIKVARSAEQAAEESLAQAEQDLEGRRQQLARSVNRVADMSAQRYTAEDRARFQDAEAVVRREHASAIQSATEDRHRASVAAEQFRIEEQQTQKTLVESRETLAVLDQSRVPRVVQNAVDAAVAETKTRHDNIVAAEQAALAGVQNEFIDVHRRIADFDRKADGSLAHARSLKEAQTHPIPIRLFNGSWWGSFFTDYDHEAAEASRQSIALQAQCPALQSRIQKAEGSLEQALVTRLTAMDQTRSSVLAQQHDHYRKTVAHLPKKLETTQSNLRKSEERLRFCESLLNARLEACRWAIEEARSVIHAGLLSAAQSALGDARRAEEDSETSAAKARQRLTSAQGQVAVVVSRMRAAAESRTAGFNHAIETKVKEVAAFRESFTTTIASLGDVLPNPLAFDADGVKAAVHRLTAEHGQAQRRLAFLEEWTRFLDRESGQLRDRLAQYVNLVCATTVGIATDEYFGDKGAFVEKQFDLLVIDEAGKVTEPEFLVAAVRAKRWVLVGDHKQLPPYYDQILDPYLHSANQARQAADKPPLDAQALRLSIFERLWHRYPPPLPHGSAVADRTIAESSAEAASAQDASVEGMPSDPSVSWSAAYDQAEQSEMMWRELEEERTWDEKRREEQLEETWHQQRSGQDPNPPRPPRQKSPGADSTRPNPVGAIRSVALDVQRRMHPDLAVFISEMFYGGKYFSPEGEAFLQSKSLELAHFPKPVTFIDICPGKGSDGNEVDLSKRDQRKKYLAEHDADLPYRGFANPCEAEQVVHVLEAIIGDAALDREQAEVQRAGDQIPLIGIIALYAGQVALINCLIRGNSALRSESVSGNEWLCGGVRVAVNSVDAFQGKECPVIILSFTRSNRQQAVGFVDDPHRLNVALSRARKKLILVGDAETLTRRARETTGEIKDSRAARQDRVFFRQLVQYVEGRGKTMRIFERRCAT